MRLSITFILLLLTVTCISALLCYVQQIGRSIKMECNESETNCYSITETGVVDKGCATDDLCNKVLNSKNCCKTYLCNK
ncbi:hypothetical protein XELAEV_18001632mg [Xenopus laevis]|nr:hypothetical protein XELAEV_18001632mg [Xenopus laevis]